MTDPTKAVLETLRSRGWELDPSDPADDAIIESITDAASTGCASTLATRLAGGGCVADELADAEAILGALAADEDPEDEAQRLHELGLAHLGQSQDVHIQDVHIHGAHALHYDDATDAWYVIKSEDIESLGRLLDLEVEDAYSRWCSDTVSTEVDLEAIVADLDEDTDLDALRDEAGAAGDTILALALTYLRDEIEEMVR